MNISYVLLLEEQTGFRKGQSCMIIFLLFDKS
jgi:hypothetical protein